MMKNEELLPLLTQVKKLAIILSFVKQKDLIDDLISAGHLGIVKGLKNYSSQKGASLKTYISYRIRGEIQDEIRNFFFYKRRRYQLPIHVISLDSLLEQRDQEEGHEDVLCRKESFPLGLKVEYPFFERALFNNIVSNFALLRPQESLTMELHYLKGFTMSEIAEKLDVTESRVSQIHKEAIKSLKTIYKT